MNELLSPGVLLSTIVFLPAAGMVLLLLVPRASDGFLKCFTLCVMTLTLAVSVLAAWPKPSGADDGRFSVGQPDIQNYFSLSWIESLDVNYAVGVDGISMPLVLLTTLIGVLSMGASWNINKNVKAYCALYLLLQTGILGVFLALDFFLFYVFWELMLIPMYFLIGVWGGPRRLYAAIKFFLFTLAGGALMLIGILLLYFASDLTRLNESQLLAARLSRQTIDDVQRARDEGRKVHTFSILAMQQLGQHTDVFERDTHRFLGQTLSWWAFMLLFIGFLIKVPAVPLHTWLPDAHVQAPTPISMILAGVLLKLGGYGILRICYPICPNAAVDLAPFVCGLGIVSMVYGGFAAMAARDFKRLVAYSSVSHMGYVLLGIGAISTTADWTWGVTGAMYQMIAHGISSAGMFLMVGIVYDRVHHRELDKFGGVMNRMPVYGAMSVVIFFAGLGLPGLCGFIGEALVVFGAWSYSMTLAIIAATVVLLTAGYILWTLQRVYLGDEYKGPNEQSLTPITRREVAIAAPLVALAILLGVFPKPLMNYVTPSVMNMVNDVRDATHGAADRTAERP